MRFTAALRRFIAPSKHKMPSREACMRVGTPPLHFYRRLPVKPGNIPPDFLLQRTFSFDYLISSLLLCLSLFHFLRMRSMAPCSILLFVLSLKFAPFLAIANFPELSRKVKSALSVLNCPRTRLWVVLDAAIIRTMRCLMLLRGSVYPKLYV